MVLKICAVLFRSVSTTDVGDCVVIPKILQILGLSASNCKSFSQSVEQFFLTVGQNNFCNKIPEMMIYIFCRSYQHPQVPIQMSAATASTASNQQQQNDIPDYCNLPQPRQQSSIGEFIQTFWKKSVVIMCTILKGTKKHRSWKFIIIDYFEFFTQFEVVKKDTKIVKFVSLCIVFFLLF